MAEALPLSGWRVCGICGICGFVGLFVGLFVGSGEGAPCGGRLCCGVRPNIESCPISRVLRILSFRPLTFSAMTGEFVYPNILFMNLTRSANCKPGENFSSHRLTFVVTVRFHNLGAWISRRTIKKQCTISPACLLKRCLCLTLKTWALPHTTLQGPRGPP